MKCMFCDNETDAKIGSDPICVECFEKHFGLFCPNCCINWIGNICRYIEEGVTRDKNKCPICETNLKFKSPEFKVNQLVISKQYLCEDIKESQIVLFLGEIVQMPGHCIVALKSGMIKYGYHTDNFRHPFEREI